MRKGVGSKGKGTAMPTSVALANRQMSLSLTRVNNVTLKGGTSEEDEIGRGGGAR